MDALISWFLALDPFWVYAASAGIAFIENIFPPFPSDVIVVAAGSLAGAGTVDPIILVLVTATGSTLGFLAMYGIGGWIGNHILETGKISFLPVDQVRKVEAWFQKYGYGVVVANRFLAGTRAVVSFFAGVAELSIPRCLALSFASALVWNLLLVYAGKAFGGNWRDIWLYLETYGRTVTFVIVVGGLIAFAYWLYLQRKGSATPPAGPNE